MCFIDLFGSMYVVCIMKDSIFFLLSAYAKSITVKELNVSFVSSIIERMTILL